jgi:hypothetical protein
MKSSIAVSLLFGTVVLLTGCAGQSPDAMTAMRVMSGSEPPQPVSTQSAQAAAPDQATTGKTRAEVYQELIDSEKSGELTTLDNTVYAH